MRLVRITERTVVITHPVNYRLLNPTIELEEKDRKVLAYEALMMIKERAAQDWEYIKEDLGIGRLSDCVSRYP